MRRRRRPRSSAVRLAEAARQDARLPAHNRRKRTTASRVFPRKSAQPSPHKEATETVVKLVYGNGAKNFGGKASWGARVNHRRTAQVRGVGCPCVQAAMQAGRACPPRGSKRQFGELARAHLCFGNFL